VRLIDGADVFVQNLAPGAADRVGLGPAALRPGRPRLICCSVSGYGPDGPYHLKKAYDLLVQCETGLVMATGTEDAPAKAGISIADIAAGMYAYSGILTALYDRERSGQGAALHVAMIDALRRVDDPTRVLLSLRSGTGPQNRDAASFHLALWSVHGAGRSRLHRHPERTGVARVLPTPSCGAASWQPTLASPPTPTEWRTTTR